MDNRLRGGERAPYEYGSIGRHTYGEPVVMDYTGKKAKLYIGSFCSIASGVEVMLGGDHATDTISSYPFYERYGWGEPNARNKGDINIGNDVWIGDSALILSGVTIGDGAVVGARAVVTHDVAPYTVVVGNPARFLRYRFTPEEIEVLLEIKWWEWDDETIIEMAYWLSYDSVKMFADVCREKGLY